MSKGPVKAISPEDIRKLRELTGCGIMECKKALEKSDGDFKKAQEILREVGLQMAAKKEGRVAKEGKVEAYIHLGAKIGVLLELNCETDFVARSEDFCQFAKDVAMQIAFSAPKYIKKSDVPADVLKVQEDQKAFVQQQCLLEQPFIKDQGKTIQDYLNELVAKIGENIVIGRFIRYKVGEVE